MSSSELLDPVWQTYNVAKDCLKIASRAVSANNLRMIHRTEFVGMPVQQAEQQIEMSIDALENIAIIGCWARFERFLIEYAQNVAKAVSTQNPVAFSSALHGRVDRDIEYWKTDDLLDVFKTIVDPVLIGQAKQIKEYRDWIAHQNPRKEPSAKMDAKMTYHVIAQILSQIDRATPQ